MLTGVPEGYIPEGIDRWMRGNRILTEEGLLHYWQQQWVVSTSRGRSRGTTPGRALLSTLIVNSP